MFFRRRRRMFTRIFLLLLVLLSLLIYLRFKYDQALVGLAQTQVCNTTSDMINDAIDRQIDNNEIHYDRIVYFEKDLDGRITALKTNMAEVNRLKTNILNVINDEILQMDSSELGIPLGSLFFSELLSGKGPSFPVKILSIRNSDASFTSNFMEAGINQTLHQLNMHIRVDVAVLVLGKTSNFTISSQVVVAETIIVGQVPETFFQTGGLYER